MPSRRYRYVAFFAIVSLSVLRASSDFRPGDNRWRDACEVALTESCAGQRVGAGREYYLISYYMPAAQRRTVKIVRLPFQGAEKKAPRVVIISPTVPSKEKAEIRREYPVTVAEFKDISVVARLQACPPKSPAS